MGEDSLSIQRVSGFFSLLFGMSKAHLDYCARAVADLRLPRSHIAILLALAGDSGETTANSLCQRLHLTKGRVSQALDALAAKGFVTASVSAQDRRVHPISLTAEAAATIARLEEATRVFIQEIMVDIDGEEMAAACHVTQQMYQNMQKLQDDPLKMKDQ